MSSGRVFYAPKGRTCVIKMTGEVRYPVSPALCEVIDTVIRDGSADDFVIDLTAAQHIDSTNLGLLAKIARHSLQNHGGRPIIVSTNDDITMVLESMGFEEIFTLVREFDHCDTHFEEAPVRPVNEQAQAETILNAHKGLMDVSDRSRNMFRGVVDMFEKSATSSGGTS